MKEKIKNRMAVTIAIIAALMFAFLMGRYAHNSQETAPTATNDSSVDTMKELYGECVEIEQYCDRLVRLADAIAWVESRRNPEAVNGNCVGYLQITPAMVRHANHLIGEDIYTLEDRCSISGSVAIFGTVMGVHNESLDIRKACNIWNPRAGERYYKKVLDAYEKGGEE